MGRDHDGHAGAVLMAFVLGAVSGAAVALLWAPSVGEDTRRLLNEKAREGRERAGDAARQGREFVSRQRDTISTAIDRGREAYERRTAGTPVETDEDVSEAPA
ncbi:MAG TPA: YtxH domain-containing protein [Acidobacteria bacterium]|jgi:gas vesicle protein|nr:YtxH domain-containing protein [Acidobacteriota bacterium]